MSHELHKLDFHVFLIDFMRNEPWAPQAGFLRIPYWTHKIIKLELRKLDFYVLLMEFYDELHKLDFYMFLSEAIRKYNMSSAS